MRISIVEAPPRWLDKGPQENREERQRRLPSQNVPQSPKAFLRNRSGHFAMTA
jgi:hypothetical protein